MRTFGLIGFPLKHSFSPEYFSDKFKQENIHAEYKLFPIEHISELPSLIKTYPTLEGLNVTIPYKERVIDYLDDIKGDAKYIGAVNTIVLKQKNNNASLIGYNTDIEGFEKSLQKRLTTYMKRALVLGSGGTSKTASWVLEKYNIETTFVTRHKSNKKNYISYNEVTGKIIRNNQIIINTTPLGMYPDIDNYPSIPYSEITNRHFLFDVIYNPTLTKFLEFGRKAGAEIVNGYEMLKYQAEASWRLWNNS